MTARDELRSLCFEQAPDAIIFADHDGIIREWNTAAGRIFGYPASEAIGQNLDLIVPEELRDAHWRGYVRALATGETTYAGQALPTRSIRSSGETIYVELSFAIVHGADGRVLGALAHARDITERWIHEREQRRQLRALEGPATDVEAAPVGATGQPR